jgi:putative ABC transport system substrate-binding protein
MKRREFIKLLSGTTVMWPLRTRAQTSTVPVVGFLNSTSPGPAAVLAASFLQALEKAGFVEGQNVALEYRWADGKYERLPALAADLIRRKVAVIAATGGLVAAQAAEAATKTIPILFIAGFDPIREGLVSNLNHPGGNATGVSVYTAELGRKRIDLLRKLLPTISKVAILVNPGSISTAIEKKDLEEAASIIDLQLLFVGAASDSEFEKAFSEAVDQKANALIVSADPFFTSRRDQIVALAAHHALPASYPWSQYTHNGGLMSYGPSLAWAYGQIGAYAGDILRGAKPSDLPVQLPTEFRMSINLKVAKSLSIVVPAELLAVADEVIE